MDIVVVSEGEEKNVANCAQRAISGRATEPKCIFVAARWPLEGWRAEISLSQAWKERFGRATPLCSQEDKLTRAHTLGFILKATSAIIYDSGFLRKVDPAAWRIIYL
jgi:hypothetical protein